MLAAGTAWGAGFGNGLIGSPHDFSQATWNTSEEACRVCHVPHDHGRDLGDVGLLWNHAVSEVTDYTMYAYDDHIQFIDGAAETQPVGTAKMCLACHDGTVALDAFDKWASSPPEGVYIDDYGPDAKIPNHPNNANDLSNTHPISITYDETADPGLAPKTQTMGASGTIADVLENGRVQCMTCHDVHDAPGESIPGTPLLRVAQTNPTPSGLCLTCHIK
jgi:hypothetical protein